MSARAKLMAAHRSPASLLAYGDSTAAASGSSAVSERWYSVLAASLGRSALSMGVAGETSTQMLEKCEAEVVRTKDTTIFMDRPNTGEDVATWIANMKAAAATLGSHRWFVMPPAQNVPDTAIANIASVQSLLLSDTEFAGHTFNAADQASYLAAVAGSETRSDGLHFNDAGQAIQAEHIEAFLTNAGW